jgi:hypothetical protein
MEEQHKAETLRGLHRCGSAMDRVPCRLQKVVGEDTTCWFRSRHSGFLSVPRSFGEFASFYQSVAPTTTLFVKRTTKGVLDCLHRPFP